MVDILTEEDLRSALLKGENHSTSLIGPVPIHLSYCDKCERYFDTRSGCGTDIKADTILRIRVALIDWLIGRLDLKDAGLINGRRIIDEIDRICTKE